MLFLILVLEIDVIFSGPWDFKSILDSLLPFPVSSSMAVVFPDVKVCN